MFRLIFILILFNFENSCSNSKFSTHNTCLDNILRQITATDYSSILEEQENILLVLNFTKYHGGELKIAVLHKDVYGDFIIGKKTSLKGYFYFENVIALVYGESPKSLNINNDINASKLNFTHTQKDTIPLERRRFPMPPILAVEPLVYSFRKSKNCYELDDKGIHIQLID